VVARLSDLFQRFAQNGMVSFQLRWRYVWSELKPTFGAGGTAGSR
jgi:hypothetical protein